MQTINALVPELAVRNYRVSRSFYQTVLGFTLVYERADEGFGFFALGASQIMLDQIGLGRNFGDTDGQLGRGVNFQIRIDALNPLLERLNANALMPYLSPETRWYRRDDVELGQYQCVVADPDGYLLRFAQVLGTRPVTAS